MSSCSRRTGFRTRTYFISLIHIKTTHLMAGRAALPGRWESRFPCPLYNRNQGNIDRAQINVTQSQQQLAYFERTAGDRGAAGGGRISRRAGGSCGTSASK